MNGNEKFDPQVFGFSEYVPRTGGMSKNLQGKSYLITKVDKRGRETMRLIASREDTEFIRDLLGDTVSVFVNDKGWILLTEGNRLRVSMLGKGRSERCTVSCCGLYDKLVEKHGPFKRLYLNMTAYGSGNALLFKPTGERDML